MHIATPTRLAAVRLCLLILAGFTVWVWLGVRDAERAHSAVYFLDVGQGDSQLVMLASPDNRADIKILIDGGRNRAVLDALAAILGNDTYIDLLIMSHPHADHYGGFVDVLEHYDVGMFISNGQVADADAFDALTEMLERYDVPTLVLSRGDRIVYGDHSLDVLLPDRALLDMDDPDEASLVIRLDAFGERILFTGDIGFPAERVLQAYNDDISTQVLKVGHHGSAGSTGANFAAAVRPDVAIIGVGTNRFGHPAERVLDILALAGARIYRTDIDGTVHVPLGAADVRTNRANDGGVLGEVLSILSGSYLQPHLTTVSLADIRAEHTTTAEIVPYRECSFDEHARRHPAPPVWINEVAWMGSEHSATHEWIELHNRTDGAVDLSGWQLLNENERIRITFPQRTVFSEAFMVLARDAANEALSLDADIIYTGALRNRSEGLRLFDNECRVVDDVLASPQWPAGDNDTKQTMERAGASAWQDSARPGGTPGAARIFTN